MNVEWDYFGLPEIPYIVLANPNKTELFSLGLAYNTEISLSFNALSSFNFIFPQSIDSGQTIIEAYDYIQNKRLVRVEGFGYFIINDVQEDSEGAVPLKTVTCSSLESELISKRVVSYGGTKALYNIVSPSGTILDDMIKLAPAWSVGSIDGELMVKFRTFNIPDSNVYNFLMNDVCKAFECVFIFDTDNKTISAKTIDNSTIETDIFLSYDNIIKKSSFSEKDDEITTCLSVSGGGDLNIRAVNPLGTDRIYDFSYFANTNWMSSRLVESINDWNDVIQSVQLNYADLLTLLLTYNGELISLEGVLSTYQAEYLALEGVQKARIQANQSYEDINILMAAKQAQIDSQTILISNKQAQIDSTRSDLQDINNQVSFSNNFSPTQILELSNFIYENTYKNENIIETDLMTSIEVQNAEQALYNQAIEVLSRVSQPRYEISLDAANYISLEEFSVFSIQTEVGCKVVAQLKNDINIETILLKITFGFNDPLNFSMLFSNRIRIDDGGFTYSDLMGNVVKTGSAVSFDSQAWGNWSNEYKDDVTTFISSNLDATTNNLQSNSGQEILINQNGLRARQLVGSTYSPKQAWLANNVLAFSNDGFATAKLALGEVASPVGGTAYGLVGEVIVGNILAGNQLRISNSGNNFVLDNTGATLTNAKFTLTSTNTKIFLNPTATRVFQIQQNLGGTFTDKFWVDNAGNVNFSGALNGATGTFSGALSAASGTFAGALVGATGTFSGALSAATGTFSGNISGASGTFTGNIQAEKLIGAVSYSQLTDIPFLKITSGTAQTGVSLNWPGGVSVRSLSSGYISIIAPTEIEIASGSGSYILVDGDFINQYAVTNMEIGSGNITSIYSSNYIQLTGSILTVNGGEEGFGFTGTFNPNSYSNLYVVNGLIVDFY